MRPASLRIADNLTTAKCRLLPARSTPCQWNPIGQPEKIKEQLCSHRWHGLGDGGNSNGIRTVLITHHLRLRLIEPTQKWHRGYQDGIPDRENKPLEKAKGYTLQAVGWESKVWTSNLPNAATLAASTDFL